MLYNGDKGIIDNQLKKSLLELSKKYGFFSLGM